MTFKPDENRPKKKPTLATNEEEEAPPNQDFISALPDDILHIILSELEIRDAAVTTAISKRWTPLYPTLPSLEIDICFLSELYDEDRAEWFQVLSAVLNSRRVPIKKFLVALPRLYDYKHFYDKVLCDVCAAGVEELSINDFTDIIPYEIPPSVFACNTITKLVISFCRLVVPSKLTGLLSVKSLMLYVVIVADDDLQRMISHCKAMERMVIGNCRQVQNIVICSPNLSELVIDSSNPIGVVLKSVPRLASVSVAFTYSFDSGPKTFEAANIISFLNGLCGIKDLRLDFDSRCQMRKILSIEGMALPTRPSLKCCLSELKKLCLHLPMNYHASNMIISCLLNSSPHLTDVIISYEMMFFKYKYCSKTLNLNFWEKEMPAECVKHQLTTATFHLKYTSSEKYFVFPKFLLLNAGNLKSMTVLFYNWEREPTSKTEEKIKNELLAIQMPSPDVEIMIKPTKFMPKEL